MAYAVIDYGFGTAHLWGDFEEKQTERFFMRHANQCFGIRKSISDFVLHSYEGSIGLPDPWRLTEGAVTVLKHSGGDTIVWGEDGEKIKDEWN